MVVVLPVPLTPTIMMTWGFSATFKVSGIATGVSTFSTSAARMARTSSGEMPFSKRPLPIAEVMRPAMATPRSD